MISTHAFGLIELVGVFGLILGLLGWQWVSIRRTLREDREKAERQSREETRRREPETPPP